MDGTDGSSYGVRIYAVDRITDCAPHSYGAPARRFLAAHPCENAHRVSAVIDVNGRRAAMSVITITFAPNGSDTDGSLTAAAFTDVENAPATGGMNDLLREGHYMAGVAHRIPSTEAFEVYNDGATVAIFDAWWLHGPTADQDGDLIDMEDVLFPSAMTPTD